MFNQIYAVNIVNTEIFKKFNNIGREISEYGLSCERWLPDLMPHQDRHNEIEINFFPSGEMTYLFHDRKIVVPPRRLIVFWGLIPHQIVGYDECAPYYVCTVPFSMFLGWKLPSSFVDMILKGNVMFEGDTGFADYDEFMFGHWVNDIQQSSMESLIRMELQARLMRMANSLAEPGSNILMKRYETNVVEQIAVYIVRNYRNPLKVADISKSVGLHPDYANTIFRKAFGCTIYEYLTAERIACAQRLLLTTDKGVTEISSSCGFNSVSSFNAAFLKITGCTPREFRKRNM